MPPTSFFASKVENDEAAIFDGEEPEEGASDEERDAFAETWNRREIKDCPDLLQLARSVLKTRTLQVHYRSKYRELISFSNASFYGNGLSVPVRHPEEIIRKLKPIEVIRSDGLYKSQTNQKEATDVVEYLVELWEDPQAWLTDILARIAAHPAHRLNELLPWNWTPASAISARAA